jgi:hypothetical protein
MALANVVPRPKEERPVIESLLAAGGGRFLAVVVLQFTARYSQHRAIGGHSQLEAVSKFTFVSC